MPPTTKAAKMGTKAHADQCVKTKKPTKPASVTAIPALYLPAPRKGFDGKRCAAVVDDMPRQDAFAHHGDLDRAVFEIAVARLLVVLVREPFCHG
jgi:hypothetical protein